MNVIVFNFTLNILLHRGRYILQTLTFMLLFFSFKSLIRDPKLSSIVSGEYSSITSDVLLINYAFGRRFMHFFTHPASDKVHVGARDSPHPTAVM